MMTAAVPWFPDNSQYRKLSIHGPGFRKHMYMGTGFFFFPSQENGTRQRRRCGKSRSKGHRETESRDMLAFGFLLPEFQEAKRTVSE